MNQHYFTLLQQAMQYFRPALRGPHRMAKITNLLLANTAMILGIPCRANPIRLYIHTTNACNLKCIACARTHNPPKVEVLDFAVLQQLADSLPSLLSVCLHGEGEPLLYNRLYDAVALFAQKGCWVNFNSNGTLLTSSVSERLLMAGLSEVNISLDGARDATITKNRPGADPALIKQNINTLSNLSKKLSRPVTIGISSYLNANTVAEWKEFISLGESLGVSYVRFQRYVNNDPTSSPDLAHDTELALLREISSRIGKHKVRVIIDSAEVGASKRIRFMGTRCPMPWLTMSVALNGKVDPCCYANVGALGSTTDSTVNQIITSRQRIGFMRALTTTKPPYICQKCPWLQHQ